MGIHITDGLTFLLKENNEEEFGSKNVGVLRDEVQIEEESRTKKIFYPSQTLSDKESHSKKKIIDPQTAVIWSNSYNNNTASINIAARWNIVHITGSGVINSYEIKRSLELFRLLFSKSGQMISYKFPHNKWIVSLSQGVHEPIQAIRNAALWIKFSF